MNSNATSSNSSPRLRFPRRSRSSSTTKSPPRRNSSTASSAFSALGESSANLFEFVSMNDDVLEKDTGLTCPAKWPPKNNKNVDKTPRKPMRGNDEPSDQISACPTIKVSNRGVPGRAASATSSSDESSGEDTKVQTEIIIRQRPTQKMEKRKHVRPEVQVCSGMTLPLICTEETLDAVRQGRIQHASCHACQTFLYCIETASMVLCPECRGISPVAPERSKVYLGLGVTLEVALDSMEIEENDEFSVAAGDVL